MKKSIAIIGGGPAGLMAADVLCKYDIKIDIYDAMPSVGRKFLMAGKSGLNITHAESYQKFMTRYGDRQLEIATHIENFKPEDIIQWTKELNIETFVGSSGRVFPKEMKASPFLRAWIQRLQENGVNFHTKHQWLGWQDRLLVLNSPNGVTKIKPDATILALGGASWPKLGSRGDWVAWLKEQDVEIKPFRPANCGFIVNWSTHFSDKFHGQPVKSVVLTFQDFKQQGEFVITRTGVEGSLIYAVSAKLRDEIESERHAVMTLDLAPDLSIEKLVKALGRPRGSRSMSSHIKKTTGIQGVKLGLLYEFAKDNFADPIQLATIIKALPVPLSSPNPLESAISCAGGVSFAELDAHLMLHKIPGVFCAGEMLDWEAPTGGYLLTACFATGRTAGKGALAWVNRTLK